MSAQVVADFLASQTAPRSVVRVAREALGRDDDVAVDMACRGLRRAGWTKHKREGRSLWYPPGARLPPRAPRLAPA